MLLVYMDMIPKMERIIIVVKLPVVNEYNEGNQNNNNNTTTMMMMATMKTTFP